MEIKHPYVFQVDSEIVREVYNNYDNYKIVYNESCQDKSTCAVYFSSNDIYYPNEESVFRKRIVKKDAFEWFGTRFDGVHKHIYIRDVFKQWYLKGINKKINTPEKLLEFLQEELRGYKVYMLGSSAGAYAAVLYGSLLTVEKVLAFNPQFEIKSLLTTSNESINPILFRKKETDLINYYDIKPFINPNIDVFYFYSAYSTWDIQQYKHVKDVNRLNVIFFKTKHHGIPFLKDALYKVINLSKNELKQLSGKTHNSILFSIKMIGVRKVVFGIYKQLKDKYKRRKA